MYVDVGDSRSWSTLQGMQSGSVEQLGAFSHQDTTFLPPQGHLPGLAIPDGKDAATKDNIDNTKAQRELGLQLTPAAKTIADMADSLVSLGFVTPVFSK